jgi:putative peptide modification system cyclase
MDAPAPVDVSTPPARAVPQLRAVLVCDLADSTALVERLGDAAAAELIQRHDRVARDLLHRHAGREIDKTDGFLVLFERPVQAVAFALDYQRALRTLGEERKQTLRARIGIHVGEVMLWENAAADIADGAKPVEVEGLAKPMAARLMNLARPGQTLLSDMARTLAQRAQIELAGADRVRWLAHGRYLVKGVPAPLAVHEVGEPGVAPLSAPPSSSKAVRDLPFWRRPAVLALEFALLLAAVAVPLYLSLRPKPAIAFAERDWVVLGDLRNMTSEKIFDDALDEAFRIGLEQSRYVNVLPALQAREALKRMQREAGTGLDREVAIELALREGARAVVLPTVTEFGGRVRISAEVVDPNTGATVYAESSDGEQVEDVLPAMDVVLTNLRERLGESMQSIEQASAPLARITTSSLDALRAFALAESAVAEGNIRQATSLLEQAIALDPEFAMAYGRLATIQHGVGDPVEAYRLATLALRNPEKLSARERMMLEATIAFFASPRDVVERWLAVLKVYPDVAVAEYNAGLGLLWFHNDPARAAPHFRNFAESRHHFRAYAWFGLGIAQLGLGDFAAARESMDKGLTLGLRTPAFEHTFPALALRDYATADQLLQQHSASWGATMLIERALRIAAVELDRGDPRRGAEALRDALENADPALPVAVRQRADLSLILLDLERGEQRARDALQALIRRDQPRMTGDLARYDTSGAVQLLLAAAIAERAGTRELAAEVVADIGARVNEHGFIHVDRLVATLDCVVGERPASERIACLRGRIDGFELGLTHQLLMRELAASGDLARAREEAAWLVAHRGRLLVELQKFDAQLLNIAALNEAELNLIEWADAQERQTRTPLRIQALDRAWQRAPEDSPYVVRLRALQRAQAAPGSDQQDDQP